MIRFAHMCVIALLIMDRVQAVVGLRVSVALWWSLPRIHSMGGPRQPGFPGGRPQWIGSSLGKPQGEFPGLCVFHLIGKMNTQREKNSKCWGHGSLGNHNHTDVMSFYRTEKIWRTRKCPVLCAITTNSTLSKKKEDRNFFSGLCSFLCHCLSAFFFPLKQHVISSLIPVHWLYSGFWNSHKTSGNSRWRLPAPWSTHHLMRATSQTPALHTSSVKTILRFPLIGRLHSLLQPVLQWDKIKLWATCSNTTLTQ